MKPCFPWLAMLALAMLAAAPAAAQTWNESGDAGSLVPAAQATYGHGALTTINGTLATDADVDLYCIRITDPAVFYARRLCAVNADPDLWLFDVAGNGVTQYDLCQGGYVKITGFFVPSPGIYYLAISGEGADAQNPVAANLWLSTNPGSSERPPDGPGAPGPLAGWGGTPVVYTIPYSIQLNGAAFCDAPVPSAPGTWGTVKAFYR